MLQRKRCVPFRRAAYVAGGIKMRPSKSRKISLEMGFHKSRKSRFNPISTRLVHKQAGDYCNHKLDSVVARGNSRHRRKVAGGISASDLPRDESRRPTRTIFFVTIRSG